MTKIEDHDFEVKARQPRNSCRMVIKSKWSGSMAGDRPYELGQGHDAAR